MREQQIEDALIELAYTWGDIERMTGLLAASGGTNHSAGRHASCIGHRPSASDQPMEIFTSSITPLKNPCVPPVYAPSTTGD
ncbi:MAG: hypothetical protein QOJ13_35 [Gaiellales bacterium]|nr:hypothetical protein [Gaiellales bacterium]